MTSTIWLSVGIAISVGLLASVYLNDAGPPRTSADYGQTAAQRAPLGPQSLSTKETSAASKPVKKLDVIGGRYQPPPKPPGEVDAAISQIVAPAGMVDYPARAGAMETLFSRRGPGVMEFLQKLLLQPDTTSTLPAIERLGLQKLAAEFMLTDHGNSADADALVLQVLNETDTSDTARVAILNCVDAVFARPRDHTLVEEALWRIAEDAHASDNALALAALGRIAAHYPAAFDRNRLSQLVQSILTRDQTSTQQMIVALEAGAWLDLQTAMVRARQLTQSGEQREEVRMTAMAVLAERGNKADLQTLQALQQESRPAIRQMANGAIERLLARLDQ